MPDRDRDLQTVRLYHQATKHQLDRAARSLGYMDWDNQPDPFRRFPGAPEIPLTLPCGDDGPTWDSLFRNLPPAAPVDGNSIARLLYDSLALSAWKQITSPQGEVLARWALRVNPSSGNLHPTEGYLVSGPVPGLLAEAGVYHFAPAAFALERRGSIDAQAWARLSAAWPTGTFLVGLTSITWRETWKYGERAYRYCQHDVGHAMAAVALAAAALGWQVRELVGIPTVAVGEILGTHRQSGPEAEHPDCLLAVFPGGRDPGAVLMGPLPKIVWHGEPNSLSAEHHDWPLLNRVQAAAGWPAGAILPAETSLITPAPQPEDRDLPSRALIRRRRSAVAMDGRTGMSAETFWQILRRLLPGSLPYCVFPWPPQVSLVLFVHRVDGVEPGLYLLARTPGHEAELRAAMNPAVRSDFAWQPPQGAPADLPLILLATGDLRDAARLISCRQDIAADGAFSLGMLARLDAALARFGPGIYPRLFRETGAIGQMLYLEAEAAGLQGTGIGCFFDDEVHRALGLQGTAWQSLYHFTVGAAVEDPRLQTGDPYPPAA